MEVFDLLINLQQVDTPEGQATQASSEYSAFFFGLATYSGASKLGSVRSRFGSVLSAMYFQQNKLVDCSASGVSIREMNCDFSY